MTEISNKFSQSKLREKNPEALQKYSESIHSYIENPSVKTQEEYNEFESMINKFRNQLILRFPDNLNSIDTILPRIKEEMLNIGMELGFYGGTLTGTDSTVYIKPGLDLALSKDKVNFSYSPSSDIARSNGFQDILLIPEFFISKLLVAAENKDTNSLDSLITEVAANLAHEFFHSYVDKLFSLNSQTNELANKANKTNTYEGFIMYSKDRVERSCELFACFYLIRRSQFFENSNSNLSKSLREKAAQMAGSIIARNPTQLTAEDTEIFSYFSHEEKQLLLETLRASRKVAERIAKYTVPST